MSYDEHLPFLKRTIELSRFAIQHGNQPFGAMLVHDNKILLEAENTAITRKNPTNHAELNVVQEALRLYDVDFLAQCTLYSSNEPCPMCAGAIFFAGIQNVVFACSEKRLNEIIGTVGLELSGSDVFDKVRSHKIEVIGPLAEDEAAAIHLQFWGK